MGSKYRPKTGIAAATNELADIYTYIEAMVISLLLKHHVRG
jgi:hypothetical protein